MELLFSLQNQPKNLPSSQNEFVYQFERQNRRITESDLINKFKNLNIVEENENQSFKQSVRRSLSLFPAHRYFQIDHFSACQRCHTLGHGTRYCHYPEESIFQQFCLFCLSRKHKTKDCNQVVCFKCRKMGHQKWECKKEKKVLFYRVLQSKHISNIYRCLNCLEYGHINCNAKDGF